MASKVTLVNWAVPKKLQSIATNPALGMFAAEEIGRLMNPYVPMQDGPLSQFYATMPFFVQYLSAYSSYQYNGDGLNHSKEMHPLATSHWDQAMMAARSQDLTTALQGFVDRM